MSDNRKIGVIDSGVGGLTAVKEFQNLLPNESIIYFGDNKNVPYGNKTEEEIHRLTKNMIDFLIEKDVKLVAVACNTISTIVDKYFSDYDIPVVSIIKPAVDYVLKNNLDEVGVVATEFTIKTGSYEKLIKEKNENINVISEPSLTLAALVDSADYTEEEMDATVTKHVNNMLAESDLKNIILGCTHFPIVVDYFKKAGPNVNYINPAYEQVMAIKGLMEESNSKSNKEGSTFEIYTTGQDKVYRKMVDILELNTPDKIEIV